MSLSQTKQDEISSKNPTFPDWKGIMFDLLELSLKDSERKDKFKKTDLLERIKKLDNVKSSINRLHPVQIIQMLSLTPDNSEIENNYFVVRDKVNQSCITPNQFYTVYEIKSGWHTEIDKRIESALGLTKEEFSLEAMAGLDPTNPLFHRDDVYHMIRWAGLAYVILAFPGFDWDSLKDYYHVRYRVGTKRSSISSIKHKDYIVLEKRCFPVYSSEGSDRFIPKFHFDQWTVLDAESFDYVRPQWITSNDQSSKVNALFYLFNAYLLGIPIKYLLILHYKALNDRNKVVANQMNKDIKKNSGLITEFDEIQIGNALSKTIRQKIETAFNTWDKREAGDKISILSDSAAIHYSKALGLLPIPIEILNRILKSITS